MPHKTAAARKAYHAARYRRKRAAIKAQHHAYYEAHREAIAAAARAKRRTPEAIAAKAEYDRSPVQRARAAAASANERARMYGVDGQISAETVLELWRREPAWLAASIAELGVLDPVKVTRRTTAATASCGASAASSPAGSPARLRIPAIIQPAGEIDAKSALRSIEQLSENLQRKDLNDIEEAIALREVLDANPKLTQAALAKRLGMSAPWVANTLRLLDTHPVVQEKVRTGVITAAHAKALVVLPAADQQSLAKRIEQGMSSHTLESEISWRSTKSSAARHHPSGRTRRSRRRSPRSRPRRSAPTSRCCSPTRTTSTTTASRRRSRRPAGRSASGRTGASRASRSATAGRPPRVRAEVAGQAGVRRRRHVDRQTNADHVAEEGRRKRTKQQLGVLSERVAASLAASSIDPMVLRLAYPEAVAPLVVGRAHRAPRRRGRRSARRGSRRRPRPDLRVTRIAFTADLHVDAYGSRVDPATGLNARLGDYLGTLRFVAERRAARLRGARRRRRLHRAPAPGAVARVADPRRARDGPAPARSTSAATTTARSPAARSCRSSTTAKADVRVASASRAHADRRRRPRLHPVPRSPLAPAQPGFEAVPDAELYRVLGEQFVAIAARAVRRGEAGLPGRRRRPRLPSDARRRRR
jgi:ParB/RepB/Spo0J family partition protein